MKLLIFIQFLFCFLINPYSPCGQTLDKLGYALIQNGRFQYKYVKNWSNPIWSLRSINLKKRDKYPRITSIFSPTNWKVKGGDVYCTNVQGKELKVAEVSTHRLETLDSLESEIEIEIESAGFISQYGHLKGQERIKKAIEWDVKNNNWENYNEHAIALYKLFSIQNIESSYNLQNHEIVEPDITHDFLVDNIIERKFRFFFRYKDFFTVWEFIYPKPTDNYLGQSKNQSKRWKEIVTYSSGKIIPFCKASLRDYYPSGKEELTKYKAIKDVKFFEGEFTIIKQGKNEFLINRDHGAIYHIGKSKIKKVGQIDLKKYKRKIAGQTLFIEDKDNEEVIFFAPVKNIRKNAPCLKTKIILDDNEFNRIFKNL